MSTFESRLRELVTGIRRDSRDVELQTQLTECLDAHAAQFHAWLPPKLLTFGVAPDKIPRRIQFIKHLLLQGYLPPRVEETADAAESDETVNVGVITGYFYPHALSLLEAGQGRSDVHVFVSYPGTSSSEQWVEIQRGSEGASVRLRSALVLEDDSLIFRRFAAPVPVHYLFPVDNYYRSKFHLVTEYAGCSVPMRGSAIIREVCEDKLLLNEIAGNVPGLRLARELALVRGQGEAERAAALDRFCAEHALRALVSKPVDAFGGTGVEFWRYPDDREALLEHLRDALAARTAMLVQERIVAVPTVDGREWNLRQYVLRRAPDTIMAPWKRVRIGHGVINTTRGVQSMTVAQLLGEIRLEGSRQAAFEAVLRATDDLAARVMHALDRYLERTWGHTKRAYLGSGSNLEADLLALDFMIAEAPELPAGYAVYLNEINDFASGGMRDYEVLAHRQAFPDADRIVARHPFSLAPQILETARWRGRAYKRALGYRL